MSELKQISCGSYVFEYEEVIRNVFEHSTQNTISSCDTYIGCRIISSNNSRHQVGDIIDQISFQYNLFLENEDGSNYVCPRHI